MVPMVSLSSILLLSFAALAHAKLYSATWDSSHDNPIKKLTGKAYFPDLPSDPSTTISFVMKADAGDTEEIQCKRKDDKWYCTPGDDKTKGLSIFPGDAVDFWFPKPPKDGIETKGSHAKFDSFVFAVETSEFDFGPVFMTNIKIKTDGGNMDWCNNVKYSGDAKHKTGEVKVKDNDCEVQYVSLG